MPLFDIGYFNHNIRRQVPKRTLSNKIAAWRLDEAYYDGNREDGYGGFSYDGRWKLLIPKLVERYGLSGNSKVLEIGCKKGFFLHDLKEAVPGILVKGVENHPYPIKLAMETVKGDMGVCPYQDLPFEDNAFDFVIAFSSVYMLSLGDVIRALQEIERVSRGTSYVTLGAYRTPEEKDIFLDWTLIGTTILHVDEWLQLFEEVGYSGDYYFTTAQSLNLVGV